MRTIFNVFGHSPFSLLQTHMKQVQICVEKLTQILEAVGKHDQEQLEGLAKELSEIEHVADLTKYEIRNQLSSKFFLPVNRYSLLDVLSLQDCIADKSEEIATLLTLYPLEMAEGLAEDFQLYWQKSLESFYEVRAVVHEFDELQMSSFGGSEADKVRVMIEAVAFKDYEASVLQKKILKDLYTQALEIPYPAFHMWRRLVEEVGKLSKLSEKLAYHIRMMLELG